MKRKAVAVIGEGITEKYYIESLKGLSPFIIKPQELGKRASSLKKLKEYIEKAIKDGFDEVFCLIDMDGKQEGVKKTDYENLKRKYHNQVHENKKKGEKCQTVFIETERCTELWFLYHFTKSAITREFSSYTDLENELHKYRPLYEKSEAYFKRIANLHKELTDNRSPYGSLQQAIINSANSIKSKERDGRTYTYSEMHFLFEGLGIQNV